VKSERFVTSGPAGARTGRAAGSILRPGCSGWRRWEAVSTTALAITGDVTFSPDRITFGNRKSLPLAPAGTAPNFDGSGKKTATLYRVMAPDDPVLLHGNRLCGGKGPQPVTFIAVWKPDLVGSDIDPRGMAAFSGSARPTVAGGRASAERTITKQADGRNGRAAWRGRGAAQKRPNVSPRGRDEFKLREGPLRLAPLETE
jgi:hypothetical protein